MINLELSTSEKRVEKGAQALITAISCRCRGTAQQIRDTLPMDYLFFSEVFNEIFLLSC